VVVRRLTAAGIAGLLTLLALALVAPSMAGAAGANGVSDTPTGATARCHPSVVDHTYVVTGMNVRGVGCRIAHRVVRQWLRTESPSERIGPWHCGIQQVRPFVQNGCATPRGRTISFVYTSLFG